MSEDDKTDELLNSISLKVANFKCFGEKPQGFERLHRVNVIVGRNNSGKSTLLELVSKAALEAFDIPESQWHKKERPNFYAESPLTPAEVERVFAKGARHGVFAQVARDDWGYGQKFIGVDLCWNLGSKEFVRWSYGPKGDIDNLPNTEQFLERLAQTRINPLKGRRFKFLFAERNVVPEPERSVEAPSIGSDGSGVTNLIQNFINNVDLPRDLVEITLLQELNSIFGDDGHFTTIGCQRSANGRWEIYLREEEKGLIALSESGSGLQTIITVLVLLLLEPVSEDYSLDQCIFGFEELENNLHPALLRRLLEYLANKAKSDGFIVFLTTHSSVGIDQFSRSEDAQIVHVTHNGDCAECITVKTYIQNKGILDDLDIRASDVLQANGVIWVEGPSDRIYLNRWISLWAGDTLRERAHYQCVFYGGRLLSHLSSEEPDLVEEAVSILSVNRNAVLVMDSDKRGRATRLNKTKERMRDEVKKTGGKVWISRGKEIENYLPAKAITRMFGLAEEVSQVGQYADFFKYLNEIVPGQGDKYRSKKPLLAETICLHMKKSDFDNILRMLKEMDAVCDVIRKWNEAGG